MGELTEFFRSSHFEIHAMSTVRIKICGITRLEDAQSAADHGADAIGFIFFEKSTRHITPQRAARISTSLPPLLGRVGVFVDASSSTILETIRECGLTAIQLHGSESPEFCQQFLLPVVKAFRIQNDASLALLPHYNTQAWLLDGFVSGQHGGNGICFDWDLALKAQALGRPLFLAGGLTPENATEAVQKVHPYALDVSSGVESAPGIKDHAKIKAFIDAAHRASLK